MTFKRAANLFVRTNASGDILSIFWPFETVEQGGPDQTGVALSDGEKLHNVAVPPDLYDAVSVRDLPADLFGNYDLQVDEKGNALLVRRGLEGH
ncbi:hypothetical protein PYH37_004769 [Sinorhizobium numidicum]|uniref:Uncharacterized protein n=1 Tax=Sinorhizobium numidicum TaxID=680248 RepID=A0ABY8D0E1_9HYPH|nr:hypothetical protein [Sinorhizobium numidicum]WEX76462.1 hypothetical protein PYH37_004769 [Sinorhizobium numidicum]WEX83123.1 hypothetical protein PYH38_005481 [Sinorhizobium numidicum]